MRNRIYDIDLRLLRVFKTVVDCGGFSAAEVELNIQRSTISNHMADLETRLGYRLCRRGRGGFALTEEGRTVYDAGLQLFASLERFRQHVQDASGTLTGDLNLGVPDNTITDPAAPISPALKTVRTRAPGVSINIQIIDPAEIEKKMLSGALHIGIVPVINPLPGLNYRRLYVERNTLLCGAGHALFGRPDDELTLGDIAACQYVARGYDGGVDIKARNLPLSVGATSHHMEGAAMLILTGYYIGFLPAHYAGYWCRRHEMRALIEQRTSIDIEFSLVTRRGVTLPSVAEVFIVALFDSLP